MKIDSRDEQIDMLFKKLKEKGVFWSYSKELTLKEAGSNLLIEHVLKYADFDDIRLCMDLFGKEGVMAVWEKRMENDQGFIRTNLMLARIFFSMDVESEYFRKLKNARFEKLKLLAS